MSEITATIDHSTTKIKRHDYLFLPLIQFIPKSITPNHLSFARILMVLPIILLMWLHFYKLCGFLFILAAILDALDGSMARLRDQDTKLGAFLDPAADKAVNFSIFLGFLFYIKTSTYSWMITPILIIDLILFQLSLAKYITNTLPENNKIKSYIEITKAGANSWGKTKMIAQVIILTMLLFFDPQTIIFKLDYWPYVISTLALSYPMLVICTIFSLMSLRGHIMVIKLKNV